MNTYRKQQRLTLVEREERHETHDEENEEKQQGSNEETSRAEQTTAAQGANPAYIVTAWPEA